MVNVRHPDRTSCCPADCGHECPERRLLSAMSSVDPASGQIVLAEPFPTRNLSGVTFVVFLGIP